MPMKPKLFFLIHNYARGDGQNLYCLCLFHKPPHRHLGSPIRLLGNDVVGKFIPEGQPSRG